MEMAYVTYMVVLLKSLKHFSQVTSEGFSTGQKDIEVTKNAEERTLCTTLCILHSLYSLYMYIYCMDLRSSSLPQT